MMLTRYGLVGVVSLCAGVPVVLADDLLVAREALRDGLYDVSSSYAQRALDAGRSSGQAQALLVLLEALYGDGRYDEVVRTLDEKVVVVENADTPEAFAYWRAAAMLKLGRVREAIGVVESIGERVSGEYADALWRVAARARFSDGDTEGALALFERIDKLSTNLATRSENALEWAMALERVNRVPKALEVLKAQSELKTAGVAASEGALLRGKLLLREGRIEEATMVLTRLTMDERGSEPARVQALMEMSTDSWRRDMTNEAIAYARAAYEKATLPEMRRLSSIRLGELLSTDATTLDEAETVIRAVVREFPEHPQAMRAYLNLADALLRLGYAERAAREYRIFLESYADSTWDDHVLQGRGWALLRLERFAEAGAIFARAAEVATNEVVKVECLYKCADALLADNRYEDAANAYLEVWRRYPRAKLAETALFQSADSFERAGMTAEASEGFRQMSILYPDGGMTAEALLRLASLQMESGDLDGAIATYTTLLKDFANHKTQEDGLLGRGKVNYRVYRFAEAMQDFAAAAEIGDTSRAEARFMIILCLYGLGRDQDARASATAFLLDFPSSPRLADVTLWLGKYDFNRGQYTQSRQFFMDYLTRWPDGIWADAALLWAARSASGEHDLTGTVELVTRLSRSFPKSPRLSEALLVQADALIELARFDEAALLLEQVIVADKDGEWGRMAMMRKADSLFALGADNPARYEEALSTYRSQLEINSLAPGMELQLHFKIGRCLEKLNRVDEAIRQYYAEVILRYQNQLEQGTWYDETGSSLFVRATFSVADLYESRNETEEAVRVLQRVARQEGPGQAVARTRIERLRGKRGGRGE